MEKDQKNENNTEKQQNDDIPLGSLSGIRTFGNDKKALENEGKPSVVKKKAKEIQRKQVKAKEILVEGKKLKEEEIKLLKEIKEIKEIKTKKPYNLIEKKSTKGIKENSVNTFVKERINPSIKKDSNQKDIIKQTNTVKAAKLEQAWKNFSSRREMWLEKGIKASDIRDFQKEYSKKNVLKKILLYASIIFFLVGGFFITSSYLFYTKIIVEEKKVEEKAVARFSAEKTISVNISSNIEPLRKVINSDQKLDLLTEIVPYKIINEQPEGVDIINLLKLFNTNIPTALLSSLSGQSFIGTFPTKKENGFVLVLYLKNNGFATAQSGVFAWERILVNDMQKIFSDLYVGDLNEFENIDFYTSIIDNQNTRILEDIDKNIRLLYSIVNTKALIIATNRDIFVEILNRARATAQK